MILQVNTCIHLFTKCNFCGRVDDNDKADSINDDNSGESRISHMGCQTYKHILLVKIA